MEKIYKNSHYLFIAVLFMAIAGFWKTYFVKIPTFNGVSGLMHFHAIMVSSQPTFNLDQWNGYGES